MEDSNTLIVQNAVKTFTTRSRSLRRIKMTAVDQVTFTVSPGETVGLVGESGSGKSTLGRCILNLHRLNSGKIIFQGHEIQSLTEANFRPLRRQLQMVFQNPLTSFNPAMTIGNALLDAMCLVTELSHRQKQARVLELLDQVQLGERFIHLYPYEMSGGQLQRAALARALVAGPRFVFLDEPTAALDMSIRGQIVNLLLDLQQQQNLSFVFVSHDLRVVRYVADRIYVMYLGEVVETGSKHQVFETPHHPYTRALLAATHVGRQQRIAAGTVLRGEVVQKDAGFTGCKLYGRCPHALERCAREPQVLREVQPGHLVRCWRAEEIEALQAEQDLTVNN
jgi:oligopeptide/dipeptide ABC transporter ATP-binding protein